MTAIWTSRRGGGWTLAFAGPLAALLLAAPCAAATRVLSDGHVAVSGPRAGRLFTCSPLRRGAAHPLPWVTGGRWTPSLKPVVDGHVAWAGARFSLRGAGAARHLEGNGRPVGQPTGTFPVAPLDNAFAYVPQGRGVAELAVSGALPASPATGRGRCVDPDQPLGIARDGVWIMPPADAFGHDLVGREVHDRCGGTVDLLGRYRYRAGAPCLLRGARTRRASP